MRILFVAVLITGISGLVPAWGQSVEFGNNGTRNYGSSLKSSEFTYLMWDRNDGGDGHFSHGSTPKFFYWDNDASKLHFLLDTGNMSQLNASFNTVGIGTPDPTTKLHVVGNAYFQKKNGSQLNGLQINNQNSNGNQTWALWNFNDYWGKTGLSIHEYWDVDGDGNSCSDDDGSYCASRIFIETGGNVGIGTKKPNSKLTVNGTAKAEEIIVKENIGADFVFEEDYSLPNLSEIEQHIKNHKHLPEIPSAEEMKRNGVKVGSLQMKLLQKIEELTLYVIKQEKRIIEQREKFQEEIGRLKQIINSK